MQRAAGERVLARVVLQDGLDAEVGDPGRDDDVAERELIGRHTAGDAHDEDPRGREVFEEIAGGRLRLTVALLGAADHRDRVGLGRAQPEAAEPVAAMAGDRAKLVGEPLEDRGELVLADGDDADVDLLDTRGLPRGRGRRRGRGAGAQQRDDGLEPGPGLEVADHLDGARELRRVRAREHLRRDVEPEDDVLELGREQGTEGVLDLVAGHEQPRG